MSSAKKLEFSNDAVQDDSNGLVQAINMVQAVIEFNLDGTILTANENFLKTTGYSLDQIKGQHHRMFCDPTYASSPEDQAFWQKLGRGEFDTGEYKRFGKGGNESRPKRSTGVAYSRICRKLLLTKTYRIPNLSGVKPVFR